MKGKLLIGVLIDSDQIPNWAYTMLEAIVCGNYAEIVLIVKKEAENDSESSKHRGNEGVWKNLLFSALCKLDKSLRKFMREMQPDAFEMKDIRQLLPNTPCLTVTPIQKELFEHFSESDCEKLVAYKISVLIKLGFGELQGAVLSCVPNGVWFYQHGDNRINRGSPAGFWEVFEGRGESGATLQTLTEDKDNEIILYRSFSLTNKLSIIGNNNENYWKTVAFVPRKLEELHKCGEEEFFSRISKFNQHPNFYSRKVYATPKTAELISMILKLATRFVYMKMKFYSCYEQFILLYAYKQDGEFSSMLAAYKKLIPPRDRFWADPLIIYESQQYYVFIEEYVRKRRKGHISYFTITEDGKMSHPKKILENSYHMSYPFVFSYNNNYYMVPETCSNRTVDLYKCIEFPEKWEMVATLMKNIHASDATIFRQDDKWWMFVNVREREGASPLDELFLYYSEDLFSENWTPHIKNPIVSDVKSARPAGRIFTYKGNIYRPSQNCQHIYGYGMKINHIVTLSETEYEEVCINDIEPLWENKIIGTHTLTFANGLTIIDGILPRMETPLSILGKIYILFFRTLHFILKS